MFGKMSFLLMRFCMFLHILHFVVEKLANSPDSATQDYTPQFYNTCKQVVRNLRSNDFVIKLETVILAKHLNEYYNKNKLILANYDFDANDSIDTVFQKLSHKSLNRPSLSTRFAHLEKPIIERLNDLMMHPLTVIKAFDIAKKNRPVAPVIQAMDILAENGLGEVKSVKAGNKQLVKYFHKIRYEEFRSKPELTNTLLSMNIDVTKCEEIMLSTEANEAELIDENSINGDEDEWEPNYAQKRKHQADSPTQATIQKKHKSNHLSRTISNIFESPPGDNKNNRKIPATSAPSNNPKVLFLLLLHEI
jgi:hypothetical protein